MVGTAIQHLRCQYAQYINVITFPLTVLVEMNNLKMQRACVYGDFSVLTRSVVLALSYVVCAARVVFPFHFLGNFLHPGYHLFHIIDV